jgi:hypothetical protein
MAKHGYTSSPRAIEAPRGLAQTYSTKCDWNEISDALGERFEISFNSYKPFACGIVIHPSIDGCAQLARTHKLRGDDIARVDLKVHSLVLELTGKRAPRTGLEAKFSVYHASAAGILFGQAGEAEFEDAVVLRPDVIALRDRIHATVDPAIAEDAADVTITLTDGRTLHLFVPHAIGSLSRPMGDADLARKFHGLVDPVLGTERVDGLLEILHSFGPSTGLAPARGRRRGPKWLRLARACIAAPARARWPRQRSSLLASCATLERWIRRQCSHRHSSPRTTPTIQSLPSRKCGLSMTSPLLTYALRSDASSRATICHSASAPTTPISAFESTPLPVPTPA